MNETSTLVPLRHPPVSEEEQTLRVDVAAAFRLLHRHGMSDLVAGTSAPVFPGPTGSSPTPTGISSMR